MKFELEHIKCVIVSKPIDGFARFCVGEVFRHENQYKVKFGNNIKHQRWLEYALSSRKVKPYARPEDIEAHVLRMREGKQTDKGRLSANNTNNIQKIAS